MGKKGLYIYNPFAKKPNNRNCTPKRGGASRKIMQDDTPAGKRGAGDQPGSRISQTKPGSRIKAAEARPEPPKLHKCAFQAVLLAGDR